jgi:acylphosphatase
VTVARRVVVHGQVQGVFFRDSARRRATEAGVTGWVRNNPDGTAEASLEGEPDDVEVVVDFLRRGPSGASVERVEVQEREPEGHTGFEVR